MAEAESSEDARKRIMNEKRLAVKQKYREKEAQSRISAEAKNQFNKRPLGITPATSTSPTAPNTRSYPAAGTSSSLRNATTSVGALQALTMGESSSNAVVAGQAGDSSTTAAGSGGKGKVRLGRDGFPVEDDPNKPLPNRLGKYLEYDLSTLKNSKGGFLLDNEVEDAKEKRQREQEAELKRKRLEAMKKQGLLDDHFLSNDTRENPKCKICGSQEIDFTFHKVFNTNVCAQCKHENPEKFSLLTKTECKEDYLLTDPELRDTDILPHLLRPNPHRSTYSNMMLFLREQVEAFAFSDQKWGSPEALDAEFERREEERKKKKNKKFEQSLKDLRRRTTTNRWHKRKEAEHEHTFSEASFTNAQGQSVKQCRECGLEIEVEDF
ncbi:DNA repair protein [Cystobasidium minutum MCA 4210]|uniref:DNA repair protein n=1 Tax=Cystobasidium minutum MCA 4210 TaxID=1397322 RepID=UPI0034CDE2C0|eukprot:jgi/Rhomi1/195298/gm1.3512_g